MPYISQNNRPGLDPTQRIAFERATSPGELNFQITRLCDNFLQHYESRVTYSGINEVIGALECAKLELYRRVAAPYEDTKIHDNGDVYESAKR